MDLPRYSWQPAEPELDPIVLAEELKGYNPNQPRSKDGRFGTGVGKTPVGQIYLDAQKVTGSHKITVHNSRVKKYAGHADVESFIAGHKRGRAAAMRELTADHATGKISFGHSATGETPAAAKPKSLYVFDKSNFSVIDKDTYKNKPYPGDVKAAKIFGVSPDFAAGSKTTNDAISVNMKEAWKIGQTGKFGADFHEAIRNAKALSAKPTPKETADAADHSAAKAEAGRSIRQSFLAKPGASLKPIARDPKRSDLDTLREAHAQIANSGDVARLSHMRSVLGNYSRAEQDRMFTGAVQSSGNSGVHMGQIDDNKAIDGVEKAAAFSPIGDPFHLLRVHHNGRKSTDDLDAIDAVTPADVSDLFDDALLASAGYA